MPSITKTLHFLSSALVTSLSVVVMGISMSSTWDITSMECARVGSDFFNGTADVTFNLFDGIVERSFCPSFGGEDEFRVIAALVGRNTLPLVLHGLVVLLLVLCLLFSAVSILISIYNSVSNPYQTYVGPIGVYISSSVSACLSVSAIIIFVLNVNFTSMTEELVEIFAGEVELRNKSSQIKLGYWLVIPYTVLTLLAIALIYFYEHTAYTQRREQQRPTEDAPKEIMMY